MKKTKRFINIMSYCINSDKIMPLGDRTGPSGRGQQTGRGLGYCAGFYNPGFSNPTNRPMGREGREYRSYSQGYGRGFGR